MKRTTLAVAVHLLLIRNEEILLLRRFNTGYEDGNYSVCAGHVDGDEVYFDAMIREAKEEIGVDIKRDQLRPVQVMHRKKDDERIDYFFVANEWAGEIKNMEPHKCDELTWFDIHNLPDNTIPYIRYAIEKYIDNQSFTDFGW